MEAWDKRYKPNLDLNHAWGGAPANIIVRKMMGVAPLTSGAQEFRIHPQDRDLEISQSLKPVLSQEQLSLSFVKLTTLLR